MSLRERKKQRTRQALVDAAARLFEEQGYDATTVEQIAAAADVSTRTFFTYFRSKADVVYHNSAERLAVGERAIASREPGEPPAELLARAFAAMLEDSWEMGMTAGMIGNALTLPIPSPGAYLAWSDTRLERLGGALVAACAGEVDRVTAFAMVAAATGAVSAAVAVTLSEGHSDEEALAAGLTACRRALAGFSRPAS
ncbi:TetR/AcrR family transcriptional regulator [Bailinhaonella thermotolerans]|uniref:TetR family transcriptional regulator n=1 Tax=Bailinhaonella thermotolerans TaxID=1070861 RepID=A0A3A4B0J6_9ACTN|nr:TetR/AcrR family transcriptional regulator [Bailinhaonella thermotolerans]RJL31623.1 TetR family transcriptional regulator [Bailinhaonella thermotolerans]